MGDSRVGFLGGGSMEHAVHLYRLIWPTQVLLQPAPPPHMGEQCSPCAGLANVHARPRATHKPARSRARPWQWHMPAHVMNELTLI